MRDCPKVTFDCAYGLQLYSYKKIPFKGVDYYAWELTDSFVLFMSGTYLYGGKAPVCCFHIHIRTQVVFQNNPIYTNHKL